jgi:hypothetical protein
MADVVQAVVDDKYRPDRPYHDHAYFRHIFSERSRREISRGSAMYARRPWCKGKVSDLFAKRASRASATLMQRRQHSLFMTFAAQCARNYWRSVFQSMLSK